MDSNKETNQLIEQLEKTEFYTEQYTIHNELRHEPQCICLNCRKCWFCDSKFLKNRLGCRQHYGMYHREKKHVWNKDN
jgi:hypothetical protein